MKIYLAARYARHPEMQTYAKVLEQCGHTITSRWILGDHHLRADGQSIQEVNARFADEDVLDIIASDYFLCFNDEDESVPVEHPSLGGRHVEFGIAIASWYLRRGSVIRIGLIGKRAHVFHWIHPVEVYPTFDAWLEEHRSR